MSDYLLDTNVLIRCLRGLAPALDLVQGLAERGALCISVLSRVEVLARMWPREEQATLALLSALSSLPVTQRVADMAGRLIFRQTRSGLALPLPHAIVAATAMTHNLTLVSYDLRQLARIEGLSFYEMG